MKLRPYQEKAINVVLDAHRRGVRSGIINLATGLGKSFLTTNLCKRFNKEHGGKTLFLVDQIELAYQARNTFFATDSKLRVGIEMNSEHAEWDDDVIIACVATLGRKGSKRIGRFDVSDFNVVVADEAHKSVSPTWLRTLHSLGVHPDNFHKNKLLVGLTATAYRGDGKALGYLYQDIFAQFDVRYGIKEGWLTDIEWISVKSKTNLQDVGIKAGEFEQGQLSRVVNNPIRNAQIVKSYLEYSKGESAIVFCSGVDHAHHIAELFNRAGVPAKCVEGGTERGLRSDWVSDYRKGKIKILTNHAVFTTGFDAPETSTIIMARPMKSSLTYTQAVGRGLRPSSNANVDSSSDALQRRISIEKSTKPICKLIDFEDNVGNHDVCRPPILFGLNPNAKSKAKKVRLYQDVVEKLDSGKVESEFSALEIVDLDKINLSVIRRRYSLQSYKVDDLIKSISTFLWLPIGERSYELLLPKDSTALIVEPNILGQIELIDINIVNSSVRKIQTFESVQGAIRMADEIVKRGKFETTFARNDAPWLRMGVTFRQASLILKLFKNECRFGPGRYPDTKQLHIYISKTFIENAGQAAVILNQRLYKSQL